MLPSLIPTTARGLLPGPATVRAYAVGVITGIIVALLIDRRLTARGGAPGRPTTSPCGPCTLIGGRLYHLATDFGGLQTVVPGWPALRI